jgi:hypothetical protein
MSLTIKRNFPPLTSIKLTTQADWQAVGMLIRQRIIERTERGVDASGSPFARYSDAYAIEKEQELGHGDVDLTVSGGMLQSMGIEATDKGVTLFFTR